MTTLPTEIWEIIVDYSSSRDLHHLLLVSKQVYHATLPRRYRTLDLTRTVNLVRYFQILLCNLEAARSVRSLKIHQTANKLQSFPLSAFLRLFNRVLPLLSNLQKLFIELDNDDYFDHLFKSKLGTIISRHTFPSMHTCILRMPFPSSSTVIRGFLERHSMNLIKLGMGDLGNSSGSGHSLAEAAPSKLKLPILKEVISSSDLGMIQLLSIVSTPKARSFSVFGVKAGSQKRKDVIRAIKQSTRFRTLHLHFNVGDGWLNMLDELSIQLPDIRSISIIIRRMSFPLYQERRDYNSVACCLKRFTRVSKIVLRVEIAPDRCLFIGPVHKQHGDIVNRFALPGEFRCCPPHIFHANLAILYPGTYQWRRIAGDLWVPAEHSKDWLKWTTCELNKRTFPALQSLLAHFESLVDRNPGIGEVLRAYNDATELVPTKNKDDQVKVTRVTLDLVALGCELGFWWFRSFNLDRYKAFRDQMAVQFSPLAEPNRKVYIHDW
ncbi:hypothetical protein WG66_007825 [Moniliophthora roreri]|nr:hypothetical protein WG66_007825 [Moniliophthora roreri]